MDSAVRVAPRRGRGVSHPSTSGVSRAWGRGLEGEGESRRPAGRAKHQQKG